MRSFAIKVWKRAASGIRLFFEVVLRIVVPYLPLSFYCLLVHHFQFAQCVNVYRETWVVGLASISSYVISWQKGRGGPLVVEKLASPWCEPSFGSLRSSSWLAASPVFLPELLTAHFLCSCRFVTCRYLSGFLF